MVNAKALKEAKDHEASAKKLMEPKSGGWFFKAKPDPFSAAPLYAKAATAYRAAGPAHDEDCMRVLSMAAECYAESESLKLAAKSSADAGDAACRANL